MKTLRNAGLLSVLLMCAAVVPSMAQFTFNFDEDGHGTFNGAPLTGTLQPDPSNGGAPALTYLLPARFIVGNGTVIVLEPTGDEISDAIRLIDAQGHITGFTADRMLFYSLADGGGHLADTGLPANLHDGAQGNPVRENADGSFTYNVGNVYNGLSDAAVPEPGALALLGGFGLAGTLMVRRRRP